MLRAEWRRRFTTATQYFGLKEPDIYNMGDVIIYGSPLGRKSLIEREKEAKGSRTNKKEESPCCELSEELIIVLWSLL